MSAEAGLRGGRGGGLYQLRDEPTDRTRVIGAGPLGIVSVDSESHEVLFSPDGIVWSIAAIPDEMAEEASGHRNTVAVGERSVVILTWSGNPEALIPSLWLGTLEP